MIDLRNKKILVTGAAGFVGGHVVKKLAERGVPEKNISVPRSKELDLRIRANARTAVRGCDIVFHVAGMTGGVEFHRAHPAEIFYTNLMMGVELMEAARVAGVQKFVTIGSVTEYPEHGALPYRETDLWLGPVEALHAPYTVAKKMLLVQGEAYRRQYGFNSIHLLMTNMYGPGDVRGNFVVPMLIKRISEAKKNGESFIEVWGTGKPTRDFLYIEDAAEGIVLAGERYDSPEAVNIASGWEISVREITEIIARLMDFKGEIRFDPSKPDGQARRLLDATKAEREFGFKAATDFETGVRKTIEALAS